MRTLASFGQAYLGRLGFEGVASSHTNEPRYLE